MEKKRVCAKSECSFTPQADIVQSPIFGIKKRAGGRALKLSLNRSQALAAGAS